MSGIKVVAIGEYKITVDECDFERVVAMKWRLGRTDRGVPRFMTTAFCPRTGTRKTLGLARFILGDQTDRFAVQLNPYDFTNFRRSNLELKTISERQQSLGKRAAKTTSRFKGVYLCRASKKWRALLEINYKKVSLGSFDCELKAAAAYDRAVEKYLGQSAYKNQLTEEAAAA